MALGLGILCLSSAKAQKDSLKTHSLDSVLIHGYLSSKDLSSLQSARLPIRDYENPQVTNSVSGQLSLQRNFYSQAQLMNNVAGVTPSWAGISPNVTIRGFRTRSNFRNGLNAYLQYSSETINIKQLDVIKGPSGTLFGSSNVVFGGLVNIITYQPEDSNFANISLAGGNFNYQRAGIDVNQVLDKKHQALFRMFGAYTYRETFQDQGFYRNFFLAPSLSYHVNNRLNVEMEAEFLRRISPNNSLLAPENPLVKGTQVNATHSSELGLDYNKSYTDNSLQWKTTSINFYGKATYLLSDKWQSVTNLVSTNGSSNGAYQTNQLVDNNTGVARKLLNYNPENIINQQVQQNFIGTFHTGSWRHRLLLGLDYNHYIYQADYKSAGYVDTVSLTNPSSASYNFNQADLDQLVENKISSNTKSEQNTYSAYISDLINPIDALSILLSARVDRLNSLGTLDLRSGIKSGSYNQTSFSPKLGLTYQLIPKVFTWFANYMNGFQNIAPSSISGTLYSFKPQYGNQWETGFKITAPKKKLDATLSYYDINVSNIVRTDPNDATHFLQNGKQYSRGVELDLQSQPVKGLFLHAGSAYNDSKITVSDVATEGLRPTNSGPKWSTNWYVHYQLPLHGNGIWSIGVGGNHIGKELIINSRSAGQFYTDAYHIFNGMISYNYQEFAWTLSTDNITNQHYYYGGRGFITPGMLRQVIFSMHVHL